MKMNHKKHSQLLKEQKFESIIFALDYIRNMRELQGEIQEEDFISCLEKLYEESFAHGSREILDRYIYYMHQEIDLIEESLDQ